MGSVIRDLSGSWCIKATDESMSRDESGIPLIRHDPDRSWITDIDPDHPPFVHLGLSLAWLTECSRPKFHGDGSLFFIALNRGLLSKKSQ